MPERPGLVVSAEHASAHVPGEWAACLSGAEEFLAGHRGWDVGSLELAQRMGERLEAPVHAADVTRLLCDCNRTATHRDCLSTWSRRLGPEDRERLLARHHRPHREAVEQAVRSTLAADDACVHVAVHSFTPVWKGRPRDVDVGLLFDPRRPRESAFAEGWRRALAGRRPDLRIRRNRPYRGWTDGLCTSLRSALGARARYVGIELEVNQAFPLGAARVWRALQDDLVSSLADALETALSPESRGRRRGKSSRRRSSPR